MRFYKKIQNGFIPIIGIGFDGVEITAEEYAIIKSVIDAKPMPPTGYDYRLRTDLTWELVELPPDPEDEATAADYEAALERLGVET